MKKIILMLSLSIIVFSCQKTETKDKHLSVAELKTEKNNNDDLRNSDLHDVIIKLPKDCHVLITLETYVDKNDDGENATLYKPKTVKIFDTKTKKEIAETLLEGIYYSNDGSVWYGDFNFDGKMDVVCQGRNTGYRDFYNYNFYLSTEKGYQFSKEFSEIEDEPLAYIKLDAKKKTILAVREAEWDESWEYKVKNNKLEVIRYTKDGRHGPFVDHYDSNAAVEETTVVSYQDDFLVMSFKTDDKKKNILLFLDSEYDTEDFNLHYAEMINDSLVNSHYSDKFTYNQIKRTLEFGDKTTKYKIYENESDFGIEITEKGKTAKLIGNPNSKKGNLSRIISLKRNEEENTDRNFENVVIEK